ncbi:hypothetical protein [Rufibacter sp. XAAS-G3-1]|uniref:hypothetical protein n=1 Tax=Rufibacter sp. XAAS-G3-1 TaxID=2729134 RepID=UPI0015E69F4A|nr:hypothetical protein [Rufibacter sp. XAAS-G3-1]
MLRYLTHDQINISYWDNCIDKAPNGLIYALSWYLDIVSPGWHAIVKEEGNAYVAVLPIPVARKFGMFYMHKPLFSQQSGLFYITKISQKDWADIRELLFNKIKLISRYDFNVGNEELLDAGLHGYTHKVFSTYHLPLASAYESVVSGYKKDRRWRINKAKRSGLTIKATDNINPLLSIFHENVAPKIQGVIGEAYEYKMLRQLYQETKNRSMSSIYIAIDEEGHVQASALFFLFKKKLTFIMNSSTPEGKRKGGVSLIIDYVLKQYSEQDLVFDFESPEDIETLADFFDSFGAEKAPFLSISLNNLPAPIKLLKSLRRWWYQRGK